MRRKAIVSTTVLKAIVAKQEGFYDLAYPDAKVAFYHIYKLMLSDVREVSEIIRRFNNLVSNTDVPLITRTILSDFMKNVMFKTGNYDGFNYVGVKYDPDAEVHRLISGEVVTSEMWNSLPVYYYCKSDDM